jgi:hypothetical protein
MAKNKRQAKLTITVYYDMGTTTEEEIKNKLLSAADRLAGDGLLTGELDATVDTWAAEVKIKGTGD